MKIKNGFVSNSSSTSFIINMENSPEFSKDHVLELINSLDDSITKHGFNICEYIGNPYPDWTDYYPELEWIRPDDNILAIESVNDNSISSELMDWMQDNLPCAIIHLG